MFSWGPIIALCGGLLVLGVSIDRFLLNRHKGVIHNKLLAMWDWLDGFRIPEFHKFMAESAVRAYRRVMGPKVLSWRPWAIALVTSVLLTTLAVFAGILAGSEWDVAYTVRSMGTPLREEWWNWPLLLGVNFIFDVVTVVVTILILRKIARTNVLAGVLLIAADLGLAFLFAIMCLGTVLVCLSVGRGMGGVRSIPEFLGLFSHCYQTILGTLSLSVGPFEFLQGLYALTSFIPTGLYLLFLLLLIPARASLYLGKGAVMYCCEKGTEPDDPKNLIVFTLLGTFFSLVGLLLKGVHFLVAG